MKKLLAVLCAVVLLAGCDGQINSTPTDLQQPDHYYEFDGWGTNPDVYEFTPRSNPSFTCIYVTGTKNSSVFCIPKEGAVLG